jgi:hypothetical protein
LHAQMRIAERTIKHNGTFIEAILGFKLLNPAM